MDDLEAAWSAGLYEGEGCITAHLISGKYQCRIVVCSSDRDVLENLQRVTCMGQLNGPYGHSGPLQKKPMYRLQVNGWDKCEALVSEWWPWLGERRKEQALNAFARRGERG